MRPPKYRSYCCRSSQFTTTEDLGEWLRNLGHAKVAGQAVRTMMRSPGILNGGDTIPYDLGVIPRTHRGLDVLEHGGVDAGYRSWVRYYPQLDAGVAVLGNTVSMDAVDIAMEVGETFFADHMEAPQLSAAPAAPEPNSGEPAIVVESSVLDYYTGTWQSDRGLVLALAPSDPTAIPLVDMDPSPSPSLGTPLISRRGVAMPRRVSAAFGHRGGHRSSRTGAWLTAVGFLLCAPAAGAGQATVDLGDTVACGRCTIELERIAVIHDVTGEAGMSPPAPQMVLRTRSGSLFVATTNPFDPLHFDANGGFVGTLGTEGEGPGEHLMPMSFVQGPGDTVWMFDAALQRRTGWSHEGRFLDTRPLPAGIQHAVVLPEGDLVLTGPIMEGASIGRPLHWVSAEGELLRSFGVAVDVRGSQHLPGWIRQILAPASAGAIWASYRTAYRVERYTDDMGLATTLERNVDWFPARDPSESTTLSEDGPQAAVRSMVEDERGHLKLLIGLPDPDWADGLGERELQPGFESLGVYHTPVLDYRQVYDFMIEVVDPDSGAVIANRRFDGFVVGWADQHHLATYRQDEFDVPIIEVFRVELQGWEG